MDEFGYLPFPQSVGVADRNHDLPIMEILIAVCPLFFRLAELVLAIHSRKDDRTWNGIVFIENQSIRFKLLRPGRFVSPLKSIRGIQESRVLADPP
jgi:hypothetical protein